MVQAPPIILGVETATPGGSVCTVRGDSVLASTAGDPEISQSNSLLKDIAECLARAGVLLQDVDLFAAASGPGSFTGLRIGLATVKALAATLSRPCIGVPTLQAIAHAAGPSTATVALLPAGRGEGFVQMLSVSAGETVRELDAPAHLSPQRILDKYGSHASIRWAGQGAHLHRQMIRNYAHQNDIQFREQSEVAGQAGSGWNLAPMANNLSRNVSALALVQFERGESADAQSLSAIYVRPSDAELKCR